MPLIVELIFLFSVVIALYSVGLVHIFAINFKAFSFKRTVSIFSMFFIVHIGLVIFLHAYTALLNPLPFWQWGAGVGGDEINFYNFMNFFFTRFDNGIYSFAYIDRESLDFSLWIYVLAYVSHLMPVSDTTHFFVPKLVSSFFVSLTCLYTVLFARSLSSNINLKILIIFLLITPDFYYLAGGIFRAPMIAYCFILVLFLAKQSVDSFRIRELVIYLPIFLITLIWILPNLKIFLNLLLVCVIFGCLIGKNRFAFFLIGASILGIALININALLAAVSFFSSDGYGDLASRLALQRDAGVSDNSLAHKIGQHSFFLLILVNLLQFFITVPFWAPLSNIFDNAESLVETYIFINNHLVMSLFLPGLLDLKNKFYKNSIWIFLPILTYTLAMCIMSTVLIRWRFPVMPLIVIVLATGYQSSFKKFKIMYFVGLIFLYIVYFAVTI